MQKYKVKISFPDVQEAPAVEETKEFSSEHSMRSYYSAMRAKVEKFTLIGGESKPVDQDVDNTVPIEAVDNIVDNTPAPVLKKVRYLYFTNNDVKYRVDKDTDVIEKLDWIAIKPEALINYGMVGDDGNIYTFVDSGEELYKKDWVKINE
jgi:hypothetical protein